jgi:hypothetical protein
MASYHGGLFCDILAVIDERLQGSHVAACGCGVERAIIQSTAGKMRVTRNDEVSLIEDLSMAHLLMEWS